MSAAPRGEMPAFKEKTFDDRRSAADEARKAALVRYQARPKADDPVMLARKAERDKQRVITEAARAVRAAEKEELRLAEEARLAELELERLAAEEEKRQREKTERASRLTEQFMMMTKSKQDPRKGRR